MKLTVRYYDLTYDDLSDQELLDEFRVKGVLTQDEINEIVEFTKAFEVKK